MKEAWSKVEQSEAFQSLDEQGKIDTAALYLERFAYKHAEGLASNPEIQEHFKLRSKQFLSKVADDHLKSGGAALFDQVRGSFRNWSDQGEMSALRDRDSRLGLYDDTLQSLREADPEEVRPGIDTNRKFVQGPDIAKGQTIRPTKVKDLIPLVEKNREREERELQESAAEFIEDRNTRKPIAPSAAMFQFGLADSIGDFYELNKNDKAGATIALISGLMAESSVQSVEGVAGGAAGAIATGGNPLGLAAGMGAVAAKNEYRATFLGELDKRLASVEGELTPEILVETLRDDDFIQEVEKKALTRAGTIGTVEGATSLISAGIANKIIGKGATKKAFAGAALAEGGIGAIGGSGGEFLARLFSGEDVLTAAAAKDIVAEGVAELGQVGVGVTTAAFKQTNQSQNEGQSDTTAGEGNAQQPADRGPSVDAAQGPSEQAAGAVPAETSGSPASGPDAVTQGIDLEPEPNPSLGRRVLEELGARIGIVADGFTNPSKVDDGTDGAASNTSKPRKFFRSLNKDLGDSPDFAQRLFEKADGEQRSIDTITANVATKLDQALGKLAKSRQMDREEINETVQRIMEGSVLDKSGLVFPDAEAAPSQSNGNMLPDQAGAVQGRSELLAGEQSQSLRDREFFRQLPFEAQDAILQARLYINTLSDSGVQERLFKGRMRETVMANQGRYLTRTYKAFNKDSGWNLTTMPDKVKQGMLDLIQENDSSLSRNDAELLAGQLIKQKQGSAFLMGAAKTAAIDVSAFKKRKNLDPRYRAFLGEVRDPVANVARTGKNISQMVNRMRLQKELARVGVELGLFSTTRTPEKSQQVFGDPYDVFDTDQRDKDVSQSREGFRAQQDGLQAVGLVIDEEAMPDGGGAVFASPEDAQQMEKMFQTGATKPSGAKEVFTMMVGTALAGTTNTSKFSHVILNPGIYFTAFFGGPAMELANGRLFGNSNWKQGSRIAGAQVKNQRKRQRELVTPKEIELWKSQSLADWDGTLSDEMLETLAAEAGFLDNNVFLGEIVAAGRASGRAVSALADAIRNDNSENPAQREMIAQALEKADGATKKGVEKLVKTYAIGDVAGKISALSYELAVLKKAFPEMQAGDAMRKATDKVRITTPTYDRIPQLIRWMSIYGLGTGQYVGFVHQIFTNTINSGRLAVEEMRSDNRVIRNHGRKRLAFLTSVLALSSQSGAQALINMFTGEEEVGSDEAQKFLQEFHVPSFYASENTVVTKWDEKAGEFEYALTSYTIPQAAVTGWMKAAIKDKSDDTALVKALSAIASQFTGQNVPQKAIREAVTNRDEFGRPIWEDPTATFGQKLSAGIAHVYEKAYKPGGLKSYERIMKAAAGEQDSWGQIYTVTDEIKNAVLPARTKRYDIHTQFENVAKGILYGEIRAAEDPLRAEIKRQKDASTLDMEALQEAQDLTYRLRVQAAEKWNRYVNGHRTILKTPESVIRQGFKEIGGTNSRMRAGKAVPKPKKPLGQLLK